MSSQITTKGLVDKCMLFLTSDAKDRELELLIKHALIQADRELRVCDSSSPLAWDIHSYDGLRSKAYAYITAITQANPGVVTASSIDSSITGHGFDNHATIQDIVLISGIGGMEELNDRLFLLTYIDTTTFSLTSIDGLSAVNTSGYTAYTSGGAVYHCGFVLNTTTILTGITGWTFKSVLPGATFDLYSTSPISQVHIDQERYWVDAGNAQRPYKTRYWQNMASPSSFSHYFFWYPPANQAYNICIKYQKEIPDISVWNDSTYPFHPAEVHEALWHGALAKLSGLSKRMQRQSTKGDDVARVEVLFAQRWLLEWEEDKRKIKNLSRSFLGCKSGYGGFSAG